MDTCVNTNGNKGRGGKDWSVGRERRRVGEWIKRKGGMERW